VQLCLAVVDEQQAGIVATDFIRSTATFQFDGLEPITISQILKTDSSWNVKITFRARHAGNGNRTGKVLAEVITTHEATVTVSNSGLVTKAICDGTYDLLADISLTTATTETVFQTVTTKTVMQTPSRTEERFSISPASLVFIGATIVIICIIIIIGVSKRFRLS